eukprot:1905619-Rhodomonas_salina.2
MHSSGPSAVLYVSVGHEMQAPTLDPPQFVRYFPASQSSQSSHVPPLSPPHPTRYDPSTHASAASAQSVHKPVPVTVLKDPSSHAEHTPRSVPPQLTDSKPGLQLGQSRHEPSWVPPQLERYEPAGQSGRSSLQLEHGPGPASVL